MKLRSITIKGMRNTKDKTYTFKDLNYASGPNGCGKSTILNAIQLALIGYIPGQSKKNASVMENCSGDILQVSADLENDGQMLTVTRTWMRKKSSVECTVKTVPEGLDFDNLVSIVGNFLMDFNSIDNMSSNQLKDFFIKNLLPKSDAADMIKKRIDKFFESCIIDKQFIASIQQELYDKYAEVLENKADADAADICSAYNTELKAILSAKKYQLTQNEKSASKLVEVDPEILTDLTVAELNDAIDALHDKISDIKVKKSQQKQLKEWKSTLAAYQVTEADVMGVKVPENLEDTEQYKTYKSAKDTYDESIKSYQKDLETLQIELRDLNSKIAVVKADIAVQQNVIDSGGICQYTKEPCESILAKIEELKLDTTNNEKLTKLQAKYDDTQKAIQRLKISETQCKEKFSEAKAAWDKFNRDINLIQQLQVTRPNVLEETIDDSQEDLLRADIAKHKVDIENLNKKEAYDTMYEKLISEKSQLEIDISILKDIIKITGVNDLQAQIMEQPFIQFTEKLSEYVHKLLSADAEPMINYSGAANSFSFGLFKDKIYKPYSVLSSGEKCRYIIALLLTVCEFADTAGEIIILDDWIDHLDNTAAEDLFCAISKLQGLDVQIILAGVTDFGDAYPEFNTIYPKA